MKAILKGTLAAALLLWIAGCTAQGPKQQESASREKTNLPGWVLEPEITGCLVGVGYAKPQKANPAYRRRVAMMRARAEIAKAVELYVTTQLTMEKSCTDEACRSAMNTRSRHMTQQLIGGATLKNEWIDPETGILYIRLIIKQQAGE